MASDTSDFHTGHPSFDRGVILVVDDEAIMRKIAVNVLESEGYSVVSATGGDEALTIFKEHSRNIRLVLLDLLMPDKSGYETYREMKKIDSNVKVILVSGSKMDVRIRDLLDEGVKAFIEKPYAFEYLMEKVNRFIGAP